MIFAFFCEWHTNVVRRNYRKSQSSEHFTHNIGMLYKHNNHKKHMLYQKNKKLQAFPRDTQQISKKVSTKNSLLPRMPCLV